MIFSLKNKERVPFPIVYGTGVNRVSNITLQSFPPEKLRFVSLYKDGKEIEARIRITKQTSVQFESDLLAGELTSYEVGVDYNGGTFLTDPVNVEISFTVV